MPLYLGRTCLKVKNIFKMILSEYLCRFKMRRLHELFSENSKCYDEHSKNWHAQWFYRYNTSYLPPTPQQTVNIKGKPIYLYNNFRTIIRWYTVMTTSKVKTNVKIFMPPSECQLQPICAPIKYFSIGFKILGIYAYIKRTFLRPGERINLLINWGQANVHLFPH